MTIKSQTQQQHIYEERVHDNFWEQQSEVLTFYA
jgi:hypothetical protein